MSFPSSFLLDSNGAVIRVYRGLVEPAEFIRDWKSAPGTVGERLSVALPFRGPLHGTAFERNYFTYGVAFVEHGLLQDAQRAFQHAIDANPSYASAWFNLGTVYLNQKNYAEARRCLRECVRLSPDDADAWNNLGMISGEEQKYDEALEEFRRAAFARPGHILPVQNMMRIFEYQGRPGDAGAVLEQLLARSPESADLHIALARVLLGQRRADAALEQFETAARLGPNRPDILNDLGAMLMQAGRLREALARFEECQRLAPDFDRPWLNMALVYEAAGQPDKARDVLTDFLRRHPDNVPVREALGRMSAR